MLPRQSRSSGRGMHMHARHRKVGVAFAAIAVLVTGLLVGQVGGASADSPQAATAAKAAKPPANVKGLRILMTNDDSVQGTNAQDGQGLYELRKALCAAGADVLVVGPWGQQSGTGGKITVDSKAKMTVQPVTPPDAYASDCADAPTGGKVYGLCITAAPCTADSATATPSDTAQVALQYFVKPNFPAWKDGPDLVTTGINFGQNTGIGAFHSGTTSAAVTAHQNGAPAIAFSEALPADTAALIACYTQGVGCPTYTAAAAFAVKFIGQVRHAGMLKPSTLLNVNYPHLEEGQKVGKPVVNVLGFGESLATGWSGAVGVNGGSYSFGLGTAIPETRKNADNTALAKGKISIVPLDGDWTGTPMKKLTKLVKGLG